MLSVLAFPRNARYLLRETIGAVPNLGEGSLLVLRQV